MLFCSLYERDNYCVSDNETWLDFWCAVLKQELEYRALKLLEARPDLTQRQLSAELGVSLGKAHYLVRSLIDVGWLTLGNFKRSSRKLRYVYLLTPQGIAEKTAITARFLVTKQLEYDALRDEILQLKQELSQL